MASTTLPTDTSSRPGTLLPPTEGRLDASRALDSMNTEQLLGLLNDQDQVATQAVRALLPELATLVDAAAERLRRGGSVHYYGAGTSGRLAVLDAAELLPTFNVDEGLVVAHIAGGAAAVTRAVEDAEDSLAEGAEAAAGLGPNDVAIGLTASGTTPYVMGALSAAHANGAHTALISCNPQAPARDFINAHLAADTGAEVITGSTRLKAGTAEKLILNGFSTALMVALGRTWSNLMVSMVATNAKLRTRTIRILCEAADLDEAAARALLTACDGDLKLAVVAALSEREPAVAHDALTRSRGSVREALAALAAR